MRAVRWAAWLSVANVLYGAAPPPRDWVPARWPWSDVKSLELLAGGPVNCILVKTYSADFVGAATKQGLVVLAVVSGGEDTVAAARRALAAGMMGIVLEGSSGMPAMRSAAGGALIVSLTARSRLPLASDVPIIGTYQGVWPGIAIEENGAKKAGPTGTIWIDTNGGYLRGVHASTDAALWIANRPPPRTIITGERYLLVIADAAIAGARWVLSLDEDFAGRLYRRQPAAMRDWRRIGEMVRYFEAHPEWRRMREYGRVVVVQSPLRSGLLSGGVLDMMASNHMPARPVAPESLTAEAIRDAAVVVNLDPGSLTAAQKKELYDFAVAGGKLMTGAPPGKDAGPSGERITLDTAEFERLDRLWNLLNSAFPRRDYGVSLFNAPSMISNVLASAGGKTLVVHLVNYSDYPVEAVTARFPPDYRKAMLFTPESGSRDLEISRGDGSSSVTVDRVTICATIQLEQ